MTIKIEQPEPISGPVHEPVLIGSTVGWTLDLRPNQFEPGRGIVSHRREPVHHRLLPKRIEILHDVVAAGWGGNNHFENDGNGVCDSISPAFRPARSRRRRFGWP